MESTKERHSSHPQPVKKHRIGIVLASLGKANINALKFLVLQMNRLQNTFEFEFLPADPDDPFLVTLKSHDSNIPQKAIERHVASDGATSFVGRYRKFLVDENREMAEATPNYFVILSLARLDKEYYSARGENVSLVALGNWEAQMAPPSILEFVLTCLVREALASISKNFHTSQHLGTKGCVCDFTPDMDDARIKVLSGFLCEHCSGVLIEAGYPALPGEIRWVLGKRWLGRIDQPNSPAAIAAKLGYNLFVTKGLSATRWERTVATIQEEGTKEIIKSVISTIGTFLAVMLGIKAAS
jgi:hypothetical protein